MRYAIILWHNHRPDFEKMKEMNFLNLSEKDATKICEEWGWFFDDGKRYRMSIADYNDLMIAWCEVYGIYEVKLVKNEARWLSYFGNEGFYKVRLNLDTLEETRKHQKTHKVKNPELGTDYNYFCG